MINLLRETLDIIGQSGHTPDDIIFIGSEESGHACTWDQFRELADVDYDSGYGAVEVAQDLVIVFADGSKMWRGQYVGSEWWNYSTAFLRPKQTLPIKRLVGELWPDLADLQDDSNRHVAS